MKQKSKQRGVTLIALVVTIIVLLILAAVSISMLTGDNGILTNAKSSKEATMKESAREKLNLVLTDVRIGKISKGEEVILNEELANIIEGYKEITSARFNGNIIIAVVDGYVFEVDGNLETKEAEENQFMLSKTKVKLLIGETETIEGTTTGSMEGPINWTIEDEDVAMISATSENTVTIIGIAGEKRQTTLKAEITINGKKYESSCEIIIVSKVTNIQAEDMKINVGQSEKLQITTNPESAEEIEELVYSSSDTTIATVDENGIVKGITPGMVTISISGKVSTEVTGNCEVKVEGLEAGDYVEYGIEYPDKVMSYTYTAKTGWRVLDPGTLNENGKYSGVKLISAGLPGSFGYDSSSINNNIYDGTDGKWVANEEQKNMYISKLGLDINKVNPTNLGMAAGFFYNFDKLGIRIGNVIGTNQAVCKKINENTSGTVTGKIFEIEGVSKDVHNLTLEEVRKVIGDPELTIGGNVNQFHKKTEGLFAFYEVNNNVSYSSIMQILATPLEETEGIEDVNIMIISGGTIEKLTTLWQKTPGIRPVVTLTKDVYKDADGWKIEQ